MYTEKSNLCRLDFERGENVTKVNPEKDFLLKFKFSSFVGLFFFFVFCLFFFFCLYFVFVFSSMATQPSETLKERHPLNEFGVFYFRIGNSLPIKGLLAL